MGISASRAILEEQLTAALETPQDAPASVPFDEEDVKQFYDVCKAAVYYGNASEDIMNIAMEESAAFLAGDKSAEDTAHIIQSRVSLPVAD